MVKVGEQGIFISNTAAKKLSPYNLSQFKKTLVLDLNALQSFTESDPVFTAWLALPPNVSIFTNDAGYLTSFSETDPIFSLWQSTYDNHADWDTAYGWGNHASAGYLTGITSGDVTTALGYTPVTNEGNIINHEPTDEYEVDITLGIKYENDFIPPFSKTITVRSNNSQTGFEVDIQRQQEIENYITLINK